MSDIKHSMIDFIRFFHIKWISSHYTPNLKISSPTVIIAPHPDDEVFGCAGLIQRLVAAGTPPHIIYMTGGEGSLRGHCSNEQISDLQVKTERRRIARVAMRDLGIPLENIHELNFPDGNINADHSEMDTLNVLLNEIKPASIYIPHWGEGWPDHINTREIILNSQFSILNSPQLWEYCVWMWYYNVWRGLDWKNAYRIKLSPEERAAKASAIDTYISPLSPIGVPWSGELPREFIRAHQGTTELFFKLK